MIEVEDVYFSYMGNPVLKGINLHLRKGEYLGIMGANGSGKTTLAKLLNGLLLPRKGCVRVDGMSTSDRENLLAIRMSIGIVFQNPDAQAIGETVEEDIVFGMENLGIPKSEIDRRIDRYLDMLGIKELRYRNISLLSGGQKQLANLAAVMAMEPECIILDEPLSMMDMHNRKNVLENISELNNRSISIILITHNPDDLVDCHKVILISEGRILSQGSLEDISDRSIEDYRTDTKTSLDPSEKLKFHHPPADNKLKSDRNRIKIKDVTHIYDSGTGWEVPALNGIDLTIEEGRILGIVGGIGSGKSTLAHLIAGLDTPTAGSISIDGAPPEPGKGVGILFQQPEDFFFEKTIRREMIFGLRNMDLPEDEIEMRIHSAMVQVGLDEKILERSPFHLSAGEQRLAAFACVIAMKPGYFVLDEPTADLDPESRKNVLDVIRKMAGRATVIHISHRIREVLSISEEIAVLKQGKLAFAGTKIEYLNGIGEERK